MSLADRWAGGIAIMAIAMTTVSVAIAAFLGVLWMATAFLRWLVT